jgi:toxin ParE1/3/4
VAKREVRITAAARKDILALMHWSLREFGPNAARRYDTLLAQALSDVAEDAERAGVRQRPELAKGILVYHLELSRGRVKDALGMVHHPRHFLVYRLQDDIVEILRVLHDARELHRHVPPNLKPGPA